MAPIKGKGSKKPRGRPPGSRKSDVAAKPAPQRAATKANKKRKAQEQPDAEDELSGTVADKSQSSRRPKRKSQADADDIAGQSPKAPKKYVQLETKTKRIPQEQIEKWPQISQQVLEQIVSVIRDAKKDIANTQRDDRKVMAAHNVLNPLVRKLSRQLAASRIPPQAKDIHFNIDRLTERNALVSREVTTARHSKLLLREQVKVAEQILKKDEENLEELKRDAKKWSTEWKHQEKRGRLHPLLQESKDSAMRGDGPDEINLRRSTPVHSMLPDARDDELEPLLDQLRRSLESLQGNHEQIDGIDEALRGAQAALDDVLFRNADAVQYSAL